jgi:hypothetical protein
MIERARRASLVCHKASESDRTAIIAEKEIGREEDREPRKIERSRLVDREDRESQAGAERQRDIGAAEGTGSRFGLAAFIQQAPATLNSVGPGRTGRVCVRAPFGRIGGDRARGAGHAGQKGTRVYGIGEGTQDGQGGADATRQKRSDSRRKKKRKKMEKEERKKGAPFFYTCV